ncbi:hypothetical protein RRF57_011264 [Xylaria bambusicola]|uniref:Uncharacterized protein n=1 Tax=Xylaria bambusicola TaxID=326684 RepID=A0AAN7Z9L4_9PEZI
MRSVAFLLELLKSDLSFSKSVLDPGRHLEAVDVFSDPEPTSDLRGCVAATVLGNDDMYNEPLERVMVLGGIGLLGGRGQRVRLDPIADLLPDMTFVGIIIVAPNQEHFKIGCLSQTRNLVTPRGDTISVQ